MSHLMPEVLKIFFGLPYVPDKVISILLLILYYTELVFCRFPWTIINNSLYNWNMRNTHFFLQQKRNWEEERKKLTAANNA